MDNVEKAIMLIFGSIISLAIWSVIFSQKSQTPQVIQAFSSGIGSIVAAAVNPVNTSATNGNLGQSSFTTPTIPNL